LEKGYATMAALDHSATSRSDIAAELSGVWKVYRQKQRPATLPGVIRAMLHPTIRRVEALRGVDLQVRRGEIVAYAGPNGAGKSTTIKLLSGLLAPDSGTVRVLGMDPVRERARYVAHIGVVFGQRTELWWDQPVAASFDWKRVVWDIPRERYNRMAGVLREVLALDEFFSSLARELSLGQRMRADLALALLHEPEILFLDEPTLGLDVLAKRDILRFVKELNRERDVTVVVTSHDMSDLEQLAGRMVLIHRGAIAFDGDFDRLRRQFADRRRLLLETGPGPAPVLRGAQLITTEEGRHQYVFDAAQVPIAALLEQAAGQTTVLDVETHRAPIDDVIADVYERWQRMGGHERPAAASGSG
ncbi:MAG TPA: ATP-binding cassette domain-containing protein, partial [Chloroflexota bacterium]|nr:ATP-binding cassette domain-containing protein [Chloroflexota bacterium]